MSTHTLLRDNVSIDTFPTTPGIYLFYNKDKELIYVGKATSLRHRVQSYLRGARSTRPIEQMMHEVVDIEVKQTDSVLEAIILEANYIKKYLPKYNVDGKDDKSWNYIVITRDAYPLVTTMRQYDIDQIDDAELQRRFMYMGGPYPGLNSASTLKILRRLFQFSTCQKRSKKTKAPCLYRQMDICLGVCTGEITPRDYRTRVIRPLIRFLSGGKKRLITTLTRRMRDMARAHAYEEAGRLRNQITALTRIRDVALINDSFFRDAHTSSTGDFTVTRIEGYDISNLGATGAVGSMVVFIHGEPDKSEYRRFKIRSVEGQSDVECLREVIERRLRHTEWHYPDIFLIDGGKPQVHRVKKVLAEYGVVVPVVGIAKGPARKKNEFIFGETDPSVVRWVDAHQSILIRVRDEAHRSAVAYQRKVR